MSRQTGKPAYPERIEWKWRDYFSDQVLEAGLKDEKNGVMEQFRSDADHRTASGYSRGNFYVRVSQIPTSYIECLEYEPWIEKDYWGNTQKNNGGRYQCSCSIGRNGGLCRHLANLLIHLEKVHGIFEFEATAEERKRIEQIEEERRLREQREELERKRKEEEEKKKERMLPVSSVLAPFVRPVPAGTVFNPELLAGEVETSEYDRENALAILKQGEEVVIQTGTSYDGMGNQILVCSGEAAGARVSMELGREEIEKMSCSCGRSREKMDFYSYWSNTTPSAKMCAHAIVFYISLWDRIIKENPGDETDRKAARLLSLFTQEDIPAENSFEQQAAPAKKAEMVFLMPKITPEKDTGKFQLSFEIGMVKGKGYNLRSLENLVDCVEGEKVFSLSKTSSLDFSRWTFTRDTEKWYDFIASRVRTVRNVNQKMERSYYYSPRHLSTGSSIPLEGSDLDIVYDLTQGGDILYQFAGKGKGENIHVGTGHVQISIHMSPIRKEKVLKGIRLTGIIPRFLRGNQQQYILDFTQFGRVPEEEIALLKPYLEISGGRESFSCVIGHKKLPEFYYRILPEWRSSPHILLDDDVGEEAFTVLPPEPVFVFYLDLEGDLVTCRAAVSYGDTTFSTGFYHQDQTDAKRDKDQENRVMGMITHFFPQADSSRLMYTADAGEENLIRILIDGVAVLGRYGEVKGSEVFERVHVRPAPQTRFSVEIEGGLLDLSIRTKDMTQTELLELLDSYRKRKRWHRLKSGDFVDLREADQFLEIEELASAMEVDLDQLVKGGVKLPKYRGLYVDKLLESHDAVAASRDRNFKALVRSFRTIRDSDFEVSEELADVMRPYQVYGFRWLSTLAQAGFGGILADEMGLGKTVQMLSLIQSMKRAGETKPSLVVCPASLVYNWKEECARFTPGLKVETVAGTLPQRKALLKSAGTQDGADLYVTSYDALKRDITLYDEKLFSSVVLDEAQYIKNQKAAVSRAVKVLQTEHRFALTGTPIENRLSELWSIFDFLMPGFLYTSSEFASRYEGPIMKYKDEKATAKLARMTEPFILRRKKTDVLKDLPEKLEETQSAAMDTDQQRIYDAQVVHMKEVLASSGDNGEDRIRILAEITRLRQICCDPSLVFEDYKGSSTKREACLDLVESAIDGGHRMLLFSQFTSMLALLAEDLKKAGIAYYTITGSTPKQERIQLVNAFNEGEVPVFLISLKAGGTGLNLTGADVVIHYDPWWNLAVQNQATDRAHRIGQTKQVTVVKLIAAGTIEEKILQLQEAKKDLADAIMGGEGNSLMRMSREELLELIS